jgi:hypothetical protein
MHHKIMMIGLRRFVAPERIRTIRRDNKSAPTEMELIHKQKPDQFARVLLHSFGFDMPSLEVL